MRAGRLRPVFRGVYAVGHLALGREGWWMAGLLVCGEGAALSHRSAAARWGLRPSGTPPIELIGPADRGRKHAGLVTHRMGLLGEEVMVRDGLRVTTPARTLVDVAGTLGSRAMREAVERAQDLRRFHPREIRAVLDGRPGRPGSASLVALVDLLQPDRDNARSHLERLFMALVHDANLPRPRVNEVIAGRRRDFVWPDARLVVETDGYRFHSSRQAMSRDRRRDRELTVLGWRPVRFTYEEVVFGPAEVGRELLTLLLPRSAGAAR